MDRFCKLQTVDMGTLHLLGWTCGPLEGMSRRWQTTGTKTLILSNIDMGSIYKQIKKLRENKEEYNYQLCDKAFSIAFSYHPHFIDDESRVTKS